MIALSLNSNLCLSLVTRHLSLACQAVALREGWSLLVLFVADVFHPIDNFSIERFLDCNVCHRRCG